MYICRVHRVNPIVQCMLSPRPATVILHSTYTIGIDYRTKTISTHLGVLSILGRAIDCPQHLPPSDHCEWVGVDARAAHLEESEGWGFVNKNRSEGWGLVSHTIIVFLFYRVKSIASIFIYLYLYLHAGAPHLERSERWRLVNNSMTIFQFYRVKSMSCICIYLYLCLCLHTRAAHLERGEG